MAGRRIRVEIVGDADKLDRAYKQATRSTKAFGRQMGVSLGGVGKAGVAGAVAASTALAVKGLKKSVDAAKEAEVAQANLRQALKATGVEYGRFASVVDNTIQSQSKLAGIDDEEVSRSFASLVRTTGSIKEATEGLALATNIARARNISLGAATKIVEKAQNGQLRGLKAIGVRIEKNTTATEAIEQAQRKFAGSAEAYGKTAAGAQDRLAVAFENLEEKIGAKLLPTLTELTLDLIDLIDWGEKNWPRFSRAVENAYRKMKPVIDLAVKQIRSIAEALEGAAKVVEAIANGEWSRAWDGIKQVVANAVVAMVRMLTALPRMILAKLTRESFQGLSKIGTWIRDAALSGLKGLADGVVNTVRAAFNKLIALLNKAIGAYNKIPLAPNLPKVPSLDAPRNGGGGARPAGPAGDRGGPAMARSMSATINVHGVTDPDAVAAAVERRLTRRHMSTAATTTGRTPGYHALR